MCVKTIFKLYYSSVSSLTFQMFCGSGWRLQRLNILYWRTLTISTKDTNYFTVRNVNTSGLVKSAPKGRWEIHRLLADNLRDHQCSIYQIAMSVGRLLIQLRCSRDGCELTWEVSKWGGIFPPNGVTWLGEFLLYGLLEQCVFKLFLNFITTRFHRWTSKCLVGASWRLRRLNQTFYIDKH